MSSRNRNLIVEEKKEGLISKLPEEILCRIISLLPTKPAAQIRLLSTRWKDLWQKAVILHGRLEEMVLAITAFLDVSAQLGSISIRP